jgi:tetratricopeptide (TPR) repeat protein
VAKKKPKKPARGPDSRLTAAQEAFRGGRHDEAEHLFRTAAASKPPSAEALFFLGHFLQETGRPQEAIPFLKRARRLHPEAGEIDLQLGLAYQDAGDPAQAENLYRSAARRAADPSDPWLALGNLQALRGDNQEAAQSFRRALEFRPGDPAALINLGHSLQALGLLDDARAHYEKAAADPGFSGVAQDCLGALAQRLGRFEEAARCYRLALAANEQDPSAHHGIAAAYRDLGRVEEALAHFARADEIARNPISRAARASLLERANRLEEAKTAARETLALDPRSAEAALVLAKVARRESGAETAIPLFRDLIDKAGKGALHATPAILARAQADLASVFEASGASDEAMRLYEAANRTNAETFEAWEKETEAYLRRVEALAAAVAALPETPTTETVPLGAPIFLVGFPRSGTTLVDQILNAHSALAVMEEKTVLDQVSDALGSPESERPARATVLEETERAKLRALYFEIADKLSPPRGEGVTLVDKLPLNILNLWLAATLFPGAKVVMVLRDPRDVCLSCFTNLFRLGPGLASFPTLNATAELYAAVMALWEESRNRLPLDVHLLRYEDLVDDLESSTRQLFAFLGLEWEDRVLDYRSAARERYIVTPSYHQVVQSVYDSSRGRWRRFPAEMAQVLDLLQPFVAAYGYDEDGEGA